MIKPAQLQWSGFSCGKIRCNGSVPVPTLTRNRSSSLELFLNLGNGKGNRKGKGIVKQTPGGDDICCAVGYQVQKEMSEADSDTEG